MSEAFYSFRPDMDGWLKNDLRDVAASKIAGFSNMEKPDTHLVDAAIEMGARIVSVDSE